MTKKKNIEISKSDALKLSWKNRKNYKGYDKTKGSIYNSWRSKIYTEKGKKIGFPEEWKNFECFLSEMSDGWVRGYVLARKNNKEPYSKENCHWVERGNESFNRVSKLVYNGEEKYVFEWCGIYNLNFNGVMQRFCKGKKYTEEEILFGKKTKEKRTTKDIKELGEDTEVRAKLSKMISSYKNKDLKRGRSFDIDRKFLLEITKKECVYCGSKHKIGVDRINNNIGHIKTNCIPCCERCNTTRNNNFSVEEMKLIGEVIKFIDKKRKDG